MQKTDLTGQNARVPDERAYSLQYWTEISRLLSLCQRRLSRSMQEGQQFSESELLVLCACQAHEASGVAQVELAEASGMSTGQISHLVERLRKEGMLQSRRAENDRRRRLWQLTEVGERRLHEAGRILSQQLAVMDRQVNESDKSALHSLLTRMSDEQSDSGKTASTIPTKQSVSKTATSVEEKAA